MATKNISCVSYHATGSGAVDDFLREFDNINSAKSEVECRFLQDPDGVSDLEYNLIEEPETREVSDRVKYDGFKEKYFLHHLLGTLAKLYLEALQFLLNILAVMLNYSYCIYSKLLNPKY